jgi:hypothetical protein
LAAAVDTGVVGAAFGESSIPAAMQLRYLLTLTEIGAEQNSTVVFTMPIDTIQPLLEKSGKPAGANGSTRVPLAKDAPLAARGRYSSDEK